MAHSSSRGGARCFRRSNSPPPVQSGGVVKSFRIRCSELTSSIRRSKTPQPNKTTAPPVAAASLSAGGMIVVSQPMKWLSQAEATAIDQELFSEYAFSVDQLMELAGLSCAQAVLRVHPPATLSAHDAGVLVVAGPGNNGGDGLVCARHLAHFGYNPTIFYPKPSASELMRRLVTQVETMEIPTLSFLPEAHLLSQCYGLIVDALFGFSFRPPLRPPFDDVLAKLGAVTTPIVSVDIPSGWHVESGPPTDGSPAVRPDTLISLTAPKLCARHFRGRHHFLGGRFVPPVLAAKYELNLPDYPDSDQVMPLPLNGENKI